MKNMEKMNVKTLFVLVDAALKKCGYVSGCTFEAEMGRFEENDIVITFDINDRFAKEEFDDIADALQIIRTDVCGVFGTWYQRVRLLQIDDEESLSKYYIEIVLDPKKM